MLDQKIINKAVNWWVDKITGDFLHTNGDESYQSVLSCLLADMNRSKITDKQIDIFKETLSKEITDAYERLEYVQLYCDYNPGLYLRRAADAAKINYLNFPFKTGMIIKNDSVRVSDGYAQPYVEI